ncbi:hypothetical protein ACB092_06G287200 [Castanea dentata]
MISFLNRMQAAELGNVCNQVLEEIAQRATNIHPPVEVHQGPTQNAFLKQRPPSFSGTIDPLDADLKMEKIFKFLECTNSQKVNYSAYMFESLVEIWWKSGHYHLSLLIKVSL